METTWLSAPFTGIRSSITKPICLSCLNKKWHLWPNLWAIQLLDWAAWSCSKRPLFNVKITDTCCPLLQAPQTSKRQSPSSSKTQSKRLKGDDTHTLTGKDGQIEKIKKCHMCMPFGNTSNEKIVCLFWQPWQS